jgi:hypothetical protein
MQREEQQRAEEAAARAAAEAAREAELQQAYEASLPEDIKERVMAALEREVVSSMHGPRELLALQLSCWSQSLT